MSTMRQTHVIHVLGDSCNPAGKLVLSEEHKAAACQKKKKSKFVTLSPTKIEVTGFNGLGNQIRDGEEHA
jgi:hypothetical protein